MGVRFARYIYLNGILLVPTILLLLSPAPFLLLGFSLVPFSFLARRTALGQWFPAARINALILVLVALTAFGFWISPARDLGVLTAGPLIAGVTLYLFLCDHLNAPRDFSLAARGLVLAGLAMALVAPLTTEPNPTPVFGSTGLFVYALLPRIFKVSNPNIVAGGIAILAPFALALVAQKDGRWRTFGGVAFIVMVLAILLLDSRGALFALGAGIAVWATLYRRWILPFIPLALIGLLALNQALQGPNIAQVVYGQIGTPKGGTFISRQEMWAQAAALIRSSPFFGIGLGAYPRRAPYSFPHSPQEPGPSPNHAHNTFFQIALDTGMGGAIAFIALLSGAIYWAWRAYRAGSERDIAIALIAAFIVLIAHGLGDTVVWGTAKTGVIFWALLSIGISFDKAAKVV